MCIFICFMLLWWVKSLFDFSLTLNKVIVFIHKYIRVGTRILRDLGGYFMI